MEKFVLFAEPWWVNFFIFIPIIAFYFWQKNKLIIKKQVLINTAFFGIAFGFVEAAVVVYLRNLLQAGAFNNAINSPVFNMVSNNFYLIFL